MPPDVRRLGLHVRDQDIQVVRGCQGSDHLRRLKRNHEGTHLQISSDQEVDACGLPTNLFIQVHLKQMKVVSLERNRASEPPIKSTEDTNHAMQQINELFQMNVVFPFSVEQMCCEVNDKRIELRPGPRPVEIFWSKNTQLLRAVWVKRRYQRSLPI